MLEDDFGVLGCLNVLASLLSIQVLHDNHVAAFTALAQEATCCGAVFEWRHDLDDVAAERDCIVS